MSLMDIIFGESEEGSPLSEEEMILKPVRVLGVTGEKITTVSIGESLDIVQEKEEGLIRLVQRNERNEEIRSLMSCPYPQNADARKELVDMMTSVKLDIANAYLTGRECIRIPRSKYELFIYMRRRPTIPIDMNKLSRELSSGEARENVGMFRSFMEKNPRLNIYASVDSLAMDTAYRILKQEFKALSNVRFIPLDNPKKKEISWDDPRIQESLRYTPNVASIGLGISGGEKPQYGLELLNEDITSVVMKASLLGHHSCNIRECMIDAQAVGHAKAMWELGTKRGKSPEFIQKTIEDLAFEDACYRISESSARAIIEHARQRGFCEGEDIGLIRVPVLDRFLLLNLFRQADDGFLVYEESKGFQYYKDVTGKLVIQFGWTKDGFWYIAPPDKGERESRADAAQVMLEGKYLKALQKILKSNRNRSVSGAFAKLREFIESYQKLGMGLNEQQECIRTARDYFEGEDMEEIMMVIEEILSTHSLYENFGF